MPNVTAVKTIDALSNAMPFAHSLLNAQKRAMASKILVSSRRQSFKQARIHLLNENHEGSKQVQGCLLRECLQFGILCIQD